MTIGFSLVEIIQFVVYLVSLMAILFTYRSRLRDVERDNANLRSVIYQEKGGLNVINVETCKEHRDVIFAKIRQNERITNELVSDIKNMGNNIIEVKILLTLFGDRVFDKDYMRLRNNVADRGDRGVPGKAEIDRSDEL